MKPGSHPAKMHRFCTRFHVNRCEESIDLYPEKDLYPFSYLINRGRAGIIIVARIGRFFRIRKRHRYRRNFSCFYGRLHAFPNGTLIEGHFAQPFLEQLLLFLGRELLWVLAAIGAAEVIERIVLRLPPEPFWIWAQTWINMALMLGIVIVMIAYLIALFRADHINRRIQKKDERDLLRFIVRRFETSKR